MSQSGSSPQPGPSHAPDANHQVLLNMVSTSNSTIGVVASNSNVNVGRDLILNPPHVVTFPELPLPRASLHFQGREDDLTRLRELFLVEGKRKVVIAGLAGYGKTELAKHFASRARAGGHVHQVFWVPAENEDQLKQTYNNTLTKTYQTNTNDTLVMYVFDNAVSINKICAYLPPDTASVLVLVTSQVHDWGDHIVTLPIERVCESASFEIFKEILGPRYERVMGNEIKEIIKFMEGIPLGLVVVAGHLRRAMDALGSDFKIVVFKNGILGPSVLDKGIDYTVNSSYTHTIRAAIHFTLDNMSKLVSSEENNITHQVLCVCAHLDPDYIQRKDVEEILHVCGVRDNGLIRLCVNNAKGFSFIQPKTECDDYYSIHRLCQKILRTYYDDDEKKNMKAACYRACVQVVLENRTWCMTVSEDTILTQAGNNETVINEMLREYYLPSDKFVLQPSHPNYLKMKTLLQNLVTRACYECVFTFLNDINISSRQRIVNEMELVYSAVTARDGGAADAVRRLVEMGGDVNAKDADGRTALYYAAGEGNEAVVQVLLDAGYNVDAVDKYGWTALHWAAYQGKEAVVRMLLDAFSNALATDNIGRTALHEAAYWGREAVVRMLLNAGSNALATDNDGSTALHLAACESNEAVVRALLDAGCNVNAIDKYGWTALHWAALECKVGVVRMLLDAGSDVNSRNCEGHTALDIAPTQSRTRVQHILRETSLNNEHQK